MTSLKSMDENKELATKSSATMEVDDLLFEILLRLPIQSIQRFITTCKQWQSLMTLPRFRKLWCKRNLKLASATGMFVSYRTFLSYFTYLVPFSPNKPSARFITRFTCFEKDASIIQSCNGLLLCSTDNDLAYRVYYVYNPTTEAYQTLPQVDGFNVFDGTHPIVSLAFDPNKSPHYKVMYFIENKPCVHVYSSDTRCWKLVSKSSTPYVSGKGVYWNGAINWFCWYFDMENEEFKTLPTPSVLWNWTLCFYFGESCKRLIYARLCKSESGGSYSVYVHELKRDYSEWVTKYHVELDDKYSILSVVYGIEDDDDSFLVLMKGDKIVRYNLFSKICEKLNSPTGIYVKDTAFQYIESLCGV